MSPASIPNQRLLTIREAAEYLGRSPYSVREMVWRGEIPVVRRPGGRKQWLDRQDLDGFVEGNKTYWL